MRFRKRHQAIQQAVEAHNVSIDRTSLTTHQPNDPTYAVYIRVTGRVQGVFFRGSVEEEARALGLRGWVRNVTDGSVEAVAEGDRESVERLVAFCRRGPPLARPSVPTCARQNGPRSLVR